MVFGVVSRFDLNILLEQTTRIFIEPFETGKPMKIRILCVFLAYRLDFVDSLRVCLYFGCPLIAVCVCVCVYVFVCVCLCTCLYVSGENSEILFYVMWNI